MHIGGAGDGAMRRWSMPWDCAREQGTSSSNWGPQRHAGKLVVPAVGGHEGRSRSNTPGTSSIITPDLG